MTDANTTPTGAPGSEPADEPAWTRHVPALAAAAEGITRASDAWDDISDSLCDSDGWPLDEERYADGKVRRDAEAWTHVETFLAHGPEVLAGVRASALAVDYLNGPISLDLSVLRRIDTTLERAAELQDEWAEAVTYLNPMPSRYRDLYEIRAIELRNSEGWHYADLLSAQGAALARAGAHLASRTGPPVPSVRPHAAPSRPAAPTGETPVSPRPPSPPPPAPPHRSR
ncbi:hypothetical protein [Streptomyces sp. SPB074]|uniref:hypothetical protein n=1 Tax=Streptomyces sp. (strain SPB074) TaxID=465543 RepID=UPI00017F1CBA|nr:hypothetical protein [Streptomyces sp. SPB074]EDY43037.1 conserved hypothetical protein [Streptomyces sp. SPB074]